MLKAISIYNYKAFYAQQCIELAVPNGADASGLTVLVGSNNSGKTSFFEALKILSMPESQIDLEFRHDPHPVAISATDIAGNTLTASNHGLGSSVIFDGERSILHQNKLRYVSSRRSWTGYTSTPAMNESDYWFNRNNNSQKNQIDNLFVSRVAKMSDKDQTVIKAILCEIIPQVRDWQIDRSRGELCIQYKSSSGSTHSSDLFGDGLASIFRIAVSVYDCINQTIYSENKQLLCIDEPELSLHPQAQKALAKYIAKASANTQICVASHSPYFVRWGDLTRGAKIYRFTNLVDGVKVSTLSNSVRVKIQKLYKDWQKPNILDTVAREIFFGENVVFCEGQEDIGLLRRYCEEKDLLTFEFFGYGVGGSGNIVEFLQLAQDLNIVACAIYDGDKICEMEAAKIRFPHFMIEALPVDDIRDKMAKDHAGKDTEVVNKKGLFDKSGELKIEYKDYLDNLIERISSYMSSAQV